MAAGPPSSAAVSVSVGEVQVAVQVSGYGSEEASVAVSVARQPPRPASGSPPRTSAGSSASSAGSVHESSQASAGASSAATSPVHEPSNPVSAGSSAAAGPVHEPETRAAVALPLGVTALSRRLKEVIGSPSPLDRVSRAYRAGLQDIVRWDSGTTQPSSARLPPAGLKARVWVVLGAGGRKGPWVCKSASDRDQLLKGAGPGYCCWQPFASEAELDCYLIGAGCPRAAGFVEPPRPWNLSP
jgi:hypothetical protein